MATATINGITFDNLTVADMLALANTTAAKYAPPKIDNSHVENIAPRVRAQIKATVCGHSISRKGPGRPPKYCEACSGNKPTEKAQARSESVEKPVTYRRTATTDIEKVRRQVTRYADFLNRRGLLSDNDSQVCKDAARTATDFDKLAKVKAALGSIIGTQNLWKEYMAQRNS